MDIARKLNLCATLALLAATSTITLAQTPDWQTAAGGKMSFEVTGPVQILVIDHIERPTAN